ncbi:MAG: SLC13 family permease [Deltaproteobacteria bacterium]|nr:SLC13 family permease [Deltaproteobacteria bacterium]
MDNEYKEVLSSSEERFERARRKAGLFLGPLVFLAVYFFKPAALSPQAGNLAAVFGFMLVFWLTEAVPLSVTAIAGAVLNVLLGVAPAKDVLAPFAHPIVFLFIGSFIIAEALTFHGLDKRFALAVFSIGFFQKGPLRVLFAIGAVSACISMWISNTAAAAMMLPIGIGILDTMRKAGTPPLSPP